MTFALGPGQHDRLQIDVHGYEQSSDSKDRFDLNWLRVEVSVQTGSFRARESIAILTWELDGFLAELVKLQESLAGTATFETLEEQLELRLKGDGRGHVELAGTLSSPQPNSNTLKFHLELDQTDLTKSISELKRVMAGFRNGRSGERCAFSRPF